MTLIAFVLVIAAVGKWRHHNEATEEDRSAYWDFQDEIRKAGGRFANPAWYVPTIRHS